ncbi:MAG TPA: hypothetical protein ENN46_02755 [Candidatus Woesearchaeota archaeon]|nr:hypothetical protein [Candidatus Woesearchaeota archaeon]
MKLTKRCLLASFIIISLPLVFSTVSFVGELPDQSVSEGELFRYVLPIDRTLQNGTLSCQFTILPVPEGPRQMNNNGTACEFFFTPTFNDAGNYEINFTIGDIDGTEKKSMNLEVINVNRHPVITSSPKTKVYLEEKYTYDVKANDPDGDTLTFMLLAGPEGMIINFTTGRITWTPASKGTFPVNISVSDSQTTVFQNFDVVVTERNYIELTRLRVNVDGSLKTYNPGDTIDAKPDSNVEFRIDITSLYPTSNGLDFDEVFATLIIEGILDEGFEDFEEESDFFSLRPGRSRTLTIPFRVPFQVLDDTFDVRLIIEAEDEEGNTFVLEEEYFLRIRKPLREISIRNFEVFPERIKCSGSVEVFGTIYNAGRRDEDVKVRVTSTELEFDYQRIVELVSDPYDKDNMFKFSTPFFISQDAGAGRYRFDLEVLYYDDRERLTAFAFVDVEACPEPEQPEDEDKDPVVIIVPEEPEEPKEPDVPKEDIVFEQPFTESPMFLALLGGIFLLLIVLVFVLIVFLFKR